MGDSQNSGTLSNSGLLRLAISFTNTLGATLTNAVGGTISTDGLITNRGTFTNAGSIAVIGTSAGISNVGGSLLNSPGGIGLFNYALQSAISTSNGGSFTGNAPSPG